MCRRSRSLRAPAPALRQLARLMARRWHAPSPTAPSRSRGGQSRQSKGYVRPAPGARHLESLPSRPCLAGRALVHCPLRWRILMTEPPAIPAFQSCRIPRCSGTACPRRTYPKIRRPVKASRPCRSRRRRAVSHPHRCWKPRSRALYARALLRCRVSPCLRLGWCRPKSRACRHRSPTRSHPPEPATPRSRSSPR